MKESPRVLLVSPHPDDESIYFGGTIAKEADAGSEVYIAVLTDGCLGKVTKLNEHHQPVVLPDDEIGIGKIACEEVCDDKRQAFVDNRREEFIEAARVLGVPSHNLIFLNIPDQNLGHTQVPLVAGVIKEVNPHVVLSFSEAGITRPNTTDHSWSGLLTHQAIMRLLSENIGPVSADTKQFLLKEPTINFRRYLTLTIPDIETRFKAYADLRIPAERLIHVDVRDQQLVKRTAMWTHQTQLFLIDFFLRSRDQQGAELANMDMDYWLLRIGLSLGRPPQQLNDVTECIPDVVNYVHVESFPVPREQYKAKEGDETEANFYNKLQNRYAESLTLSNAA